MTLVEEWLWKHYTKKTFDIIICNHCEEVFSKQNRLQILKHHLYDKHEITELDEHPDRDNIQQNYKITSLTATCNHCMKRIDLAIIGVSILLIHLKLKHSDKYNLKERKISHIWNRYDEKGDNVMCKVCKKTIKLNSKHLTSGLRRHLIHCRGTKNDDLDVHKLMEVQTRSHVQWTEWKTSLRKKYITTFTTTCNRCKKPITIYCRYPALSLKAHLRSCPASTNNLLEKHKLKKKSRIKEIWNYYDVIDDMTVCKRCKRPIKADDRVTSNLHTHARICGNIEKRKRKVTQILDKFDITGDKAKCKGCRKTLKVCGKYPAPNLANHLKYCRPPKFDEFGREIKESLKISHLWDEYDITGDQATCKGCKKIVKVNSKFPRSNLFRHFRSCPRVEVDLLKKDEVKTIRRLSQIWEKFDEDGDMMICKQCKKAIKMSNAKTTSSLHSHLRHCRQTPEKTNIWDNFDVTGDKATCKGCKKTIKVNSKYPRVSVYRHFNSCPLVNKEPNKLEKKRILSKLWEKYNIIGIATCKQCKKTVEVNNKCPKISLKQHLRYCQSSTSDQSDKCKSKKKQKILKLRDKYDIIYKTATCIHCNKIIKLKQRKLNSKTITSALNLHFRICRVSEDGLKKIRRRSQLWDKLNVTGNKATCKGCNKTVKVTSRFPTRNIASHLKHCPVFAYNRLDTRKPEVTRQISEPWDKYDVTGDTATCKGCKETIKLNSETPTANLNEHLEYCRSSENNDMDKYKLEKIRRKSILWTKFDVTGDRAVCKQCKKSVKVNAKLPTVNLNHHFRCCQLKKELKYMM